MKKVFSKIVILLCVVLAACSLFAACSPGILGISIADGDAPRAVYVKGQDLDLSQGKISVLTKDGSTTLPLTTEGVSVSGYDKEKVGKQTLTVTYEEKTTTFEVEVVERMLVENHEKNYFVGDEFNKSKGRIRIASDNGSYDTTVQMKIDDVVVTGFDSSVARKDAPVTVTYKEYTGTFTVNIYDVEDVTFNKPRKLFYQSHDAEINLDGSYFMLKSEDGIVSKQILVTDDMVEGFDLTQATLENARENPLKQTVTVNYGGEKYNFEIEIKYSDVSYINAVAAESDKLDWSKGAPEISKELGDKAVEVVGLYSKLSREDLAYVSKEAANSIARAAAVYGRAQWIEQAKAFEDVFAYNVTAQGGRFVLFGKTYEASKAAAEAIANAESDFNKLTNVLSSIKTTYADQVIFGEELYKNYLIDVCTIEQLAEVNKILNYLVTLYDVAKAIPDNWTKESIKTSEQSQAVTAVITRMTASEYNNPAYREFYRIVSKWRANDDLAEILFTYYYADFEAAKTDDEKKAAIANMNVIAQLCLPDAIDEVYSYAENGLVYLMNMYPNPAGNVYLAYGDATVLMYYYYKAVDAYNNIAKNGTDMEKTLLANLTFGGYFTSNGNPVAVPIVNFITYVQNAQTYGYTARAGVLYGDRTYNELWSQIVNIIDKSASDETYVEGGQYGRDVSEMFTKFAAQSAAWQFHFNASVNAYYPQIPTLAWDYSQGYNNNMVKHVVEYYTSVLPKNAHEALNPLLVAMESYAKYQLTTAADDLISFYSNMSKVVAVYENLANDKTAFDQHLGEVYNKYKAIYDRFGYQADGTLADTKAITDFGDYQETFDEMIEALGNVFVAANYNFYGGLFSAYEKAIKLIDEIFASENQELIDACYHQIFTIRCRLSTVREFKLTIDSYVLQVRQFYVQYLNGLTIGNIPLSSLYTEAVRDFLITVDTLMWERFFDDKNPETQSYTPEAAMAAMEAYRKLGVTDRYVVSIMASNYVAGIVEYAKEVMSEKAAAAANALMVLEKMHTQYEYINKEMDELLATIPDNLDPELKAQLISIIEKNKADAEKAFKDAYAAFAKAYGELTEAEKAEFDAVMKAAREYYEAKYNEAFPA